MLREGLMYRFIGVELSRHFLFQYFNGLSFSVPKFAPRRKKMMTKLYRLEKRVNFALLSICQVVVFAWQCVYLPAK